MTPEEAISLCMRVHYRIMENPRFWYDQALMDASKMFCMAASNLRKREKWLAEEMIRVREDFSRMPRKEQVRRTQAIVDLTTSPSHRSP